MWLATVLLFLSGAQGSHQQVCSTAAHLGRWWYNGCNQRCVCEQVASEFVWTCYRERKEFTCMSSAERKLFIATYKAISTPGHPQYSQYQTLIARHATNFATIHTSQWFLPWHRWFQLAMENLLQNVDCKVTLPWWDTAKNAGTPFTVSPWGAAIDLLGTSGACVTNGGFASPGWPSNAHGCLSRTLSGVLPSAMQENTVLAVAATNYVTFTDTLETVIHNIAHVRVGGTMVQTWSPEAPEFFLHHGHIDKLWGDWQKKSNVHLNAYSSAFSASATMPVALGTTPAQVNDLKDIKVSYVRSASSSAGLGHFVLAACNLLVLKPFFIDFATLQFSIINANQSQILQIPQLPAPILSSDEEKMLIDMSSRGGADEEFLAVFARKLATAKSLLTEANDALSKSGALRTGFTSPIDKALGFDVAKAVEVLKVPYVPRPPNPCGRGTQYCEDLRRCLPISRKCNS